MRLVNRRQLHVIFLELGVPRQAALATVLHIIDVRYGTVCILHLVVAWLQFVDALHESVVLINHRIEGELFIKFILPP